MPQVGSSLAHARGPPRRTRPRPFQATRLRGRARGGRSWRNHARSGYSGTRARNVVRCGRRLQPQQPSARGRSRARTGGNRSSWLSFSPLIGAQGDAAGRRAGSMLIMPRLWCCMTIGAGSGCRLSAWAGRGTRRTGRADELDDRKAAAGGGGAGSVVVDVEPVRVPLRNDERVLRATEHHERCHQPGGTVGQHPEQEQSGDRARGETSAT